MSDPVQEPAAIPLKHQYYLSEYRYCLPLLKCIVCCLYRSDLATDSVRENISVIDIGYGSYGLITENCNVAAIYVKCGNLAAM